MPIDISTLKPFWSNTSHYQIQFLYMLKFSELFGNISRLATYKSYIHEMQKCKIFLEGVLKQNNKLMYTNLIFPFYDFSGRKI